MMYILVPNFLARFAISSETLYPFAINSSILVVLSPKKFDNSTSSFIFSLLVLSFLIEKLVPAELE